MVPADKTLELSKLAYMTMLLEQNETELKESFPDWEYGIEISGAHTFDHRNHSVTLYVTPYWEEDNGVSIAITNRGDYCDYNKVIPFNPTGDNEKDFLAYKKIVVELISLIEMVIKTVLV